ncbi:MAG: TIGR03936 family radical SAM-associated protein [Lachnospiraceae bacterium]|nr:TIGR03936 family radical SAM-associated protein [Lachnospiraceae bacterium]
MKVRIKFSKTGPLKFIGHLDMMRFFQKAIRRADIDVTYTTGFSPHQVMAFANPLGVGLESTGEYFDIEVNSYTTMAEMKDKLNQVVVPGVEILDVCLLPDDAGNAMASVAAARYRISFREGMEPCADWESRFASFCEQETIPATKTTKKSVLEIDIKPSLYEWQILPDHSIMLFLNASSSGTGNIKPAMVLETFFKAEGIEFDPYCLCITRIDTYTDLGTEDAHRFVPMNEVGTSC